jgi:hypothetical protein
MASPVILAETGVTYEEASIAEWLETHDTCPVTGQQLGSNLLVPNHSMKALITAWTHSQVARLMETNGQPSPAPSAPSRPIDGAYSIAVVHDDIVNSSNEPAFTPSTVYTNADAAAASHQSCDPAATSTVVHRSPSFETTSATMARVIEKSTTTAAALAAAARTTSGWFCQ